MTQSRGQTQESLGTSSNRLEALCARHAALSHNIDDMMKFRSTSDLDLRRLKREKLHLKEEIEKIRQTS